MLKRTLNMTPYTINRPYSIASSTSDTFVKSNIQIDVQLKVKRK
jgi:hypothetical protein